MTSRLLLKLGSFSSLLLAFAASACAGSSDGDDRSESSEWAYGSATGLPLPLACPLPPVGSVLPAEAGQWTKERVEDVTLSLRRPAGAGTAVAALSDGAVHVGYYSHGYYCGGGPMTLGRNGALRHALRTPGEAGGASRWQTSTVTCRERGYWPSYSVDVSDRLLVTWGAGLSGSILQLSQAARFENGQWGSYANAAQGRAASAITSDCTGRALVFTSGSLWGEAGGTSGYVKLGSPFTDSKAARIKRSAQGVIHVAAAAAVPNGATSNTYLPRYARLDGATWTVEDPTLGQGTEIVGLDVDSTGEPHVLFTKRRDDTMLVVHAARTTSGWVHDAVGPAEGDVAFAIGGGDELVVVLGNTMARRKLTTPSWTLTPALHGSAKLSSMTIDQRGDVHTAFYTSAGSGSYEAPSTVYYARFGAPAPSP